MKPRACKVARPPLRKYEVSCGFSAIAEFLIVHNLHRQQRNTLTQRLHRRRPAVFQLSLVALHMSIIANATRLACVTASVTNTCVSSSHNSAGGRRAQASRSAPDVCSVQKHSLEFTPHTPSERRSAGCCWLPAQTERSACRRTIVIVLNSGPSSAKAIFCSLSARHLNHDSTRPQPF